VTESFQCELRTVNRVSPSTLEFIFETSDARTVEFEPGQFFRFTFSDGAGEFERSYSLCNRALDPSGQLQLVVSEVEGGRATRLLFEAKPGLVADVSGPFGRLLVPKPRPARLVMVATSVGIAPFIPMLSLLSRELEDLQVVLLFGVRDEAEFLYRDDLLKLREHPSFDLRVCYSRQSSNQSFEYDGYVTNQIDSIAPDPERDHFLICGNPQMIDDAYGLLKPLGFKPRQVTREKYVFAKTAATKLTGPTAAQKELIAQKLAALKKKT